VTGLTTPVQLQGKLCTTLLKHAVAPRQGIDVLTQAVEACKASIEAAKGRMVVKEAARAVSEKEERALEEELQVGCHEWFCSNAACCTWDAAATLGTK
jgi:hypothetical protein